MPRLTLLLGTLLLSWIACAASAASSPSDDFAVMKSRLYQRYLTAPGPVPSVIGTLLDEPVTSMIQRLRPDGSWDDVVYHDLSVPYLPAMPHLYRLVRMTQVYRAPDTTAELRAALREPIHAALGFWLREKPMASNGWFNTIGSPNEIAKILVLMDHELDEAERAGCLEILKRANHNGTLIYGGAPATGQNLLWQAGLQIVAGCFERSETELATFAKRAAEEITITTEEGIQPDFSFHQHGPQLYSGGYGESFAIDGAFWASVLHGTRFAWPRETIEIFSALLLDGQQWMSRGRMWDFGVVGRELARMNKDASKLALACEDMASLQTEREEEFRAFAARVRREENAPQISGNRSFWRSDFISHVRPEFYASVRMTSRRLFGSESGNGEAIFNNHLGDGAMCLMRTGEEYRDIFPLWNWRRIPGVTCLDSKEALPVFTWGIGSNGGSEFAGGVSDGEFGAAAFELQRGGVHALKSWFFLPGGIVCLGVGLQAHTDMPAITTVNQSWGRGAVVVNGQTLGSNRAEKRDGPLWVHHDGVAYFFEEGAAVHVAHEQRTGRWSDINLHHRGAINEVSGDVFSLWIDHGNIRSPEAYRYVIVPGLALENTDGYLDRSAPITIVNSTSVQAASTRDGSIAQAIFWREGRVSFADGLTVEADRAAAIQIRREKEGFVVSAADPTNSGVTVNVRLNRRLSGERCVADESGSTITFVFPSGAYAGKSITRSLVALP